ncbi:MAG: outer membrane lipoprotein LolB [Hydrogenophaga sp.]|nr:outer membrane lipoprotein LolB [Hydrogenophaga sp.]
MKAWHSPARGLTRRGISLALPLVLAACAVPQTTLPDGEPGWSGRLSLRVDTEPVQLVSAGFSLQGSPRQGYFVLTSPLGTAVASATWDGDSAEWRQGNQVVRKGSLDELATELGGAALPVSALFAWLRGEAAVADGWQADLSRRGEGRILARRSTPLPSAELRLIVEP